ncbi:MAG: ABC transporter permease [Chloroflexi bacterium]|nr:ABC transporter permease [Chloroflexota bacterium]
MRPFDLIKLIFTNLTRSRFRAALSASGVVIGTAAVVILVSLATGVQAYASQGLRSIGPLNQIQVNSRRGGGGMGFFVGLSETNATKLTPKYLEQLARQTEVAAVTPRERLSGVELNYKRFRSGATIFGESMAGLRDFGLTAQSGSLSPGKREVIVGAKVGESFTDPRRAGDNQVAAVNLQGRTLSIRLSRKDANGKTVTRLVQVHVTGVLAEQGGDSDYNVLMPLSDYEELNAWLKGARTNRQQDGYSSATVLARSSENVATLTQKIQSDGLSAFSSQQALDRINGVFNVLQAFVGGIAAITLAIAGTGIANTLITAIYERTREIGLMKAVGATDGQVLTVFLAEAGAIGAIGGAGGLLVGWGFSFAANILVRQFYLSQLTQGGSSPQGDLVVTPLWVFIAGPLLAVGMGMLAGLYPARRAASLDPVEALRSE